MNIEIEYLPRPDPPEKAAPPLGTEVYVYHKHPYRRYPGIPTEEKVAVYRGRLRAVIPANRPPFESLIEAGILPDGSRPSIYERWVLDTFFQGSKTPRSRVLTMNKHHTWKLRSEVEGSR